LNGSIKNSEGVRIGTALNAELVFGEAKMKKCPYCAEEIQTAAKLCRYCNRNVGLDWKKAVSTLILIAIVVGTAVGLFLKFQRHASETIEVALRQENQRIALLAREEMQREFNQVQEIYYKKLITKLAMQINQLVKLMDSTFSYEDQQHLLEQYLAAFNVSKKIVLEKIPEETDAVYKRLLSELAYSIDECTRYCNIKMRAVTYILTKLQLAREMGVSQEAALKQLELAKVESPFIERARQSNYFEEDVAEKMNEIHKLVSPTARLEREAQESANKVMLRVNNLTVFLKQLDLDYRTLFSAIHWDEED